ncbi:MAG: hypothetical protein ACFFCL_03615 [Promethearchaeota archaeon]
MFKKELKALLMLLSLTIAFTVALYSNSLNYGSYVEKLNGKKTVGVYDLRVSGPQINITTPENKTYYGPMNGYYPATYGFENDENGAFPQDWTRFGTNPSIINEIIDELDGHKKVLSMDKGDTYGSNNHVVQFFDETQEYGTIEFWGRTNNVSQESSWHLKSGSLNEFAICGLRMYNNYFEYYRGADWQSVAYVANNSQWYHIKIQFECGIGNHYGLSQYYWRFFVNGVEFGDYQFVSSQSNVSHINIHQNWRYDNFHTYTDAIGYSWDPNYIIGDNLYEGLLLSYTNSTRLDWIGYSLDGLATKTILGNITFPFLSDGLHTIQVFGNNSIGTMYHSDVRYFTILVSEPSPPGIPGYHLFIIIGIISIVSAIIIKKKFKF